MGTITVFRSDADRFIDAKAEAFPAIAALRALLPPPTDQAGLRIRSLFADLLEQIPPLKNISLLEAVWLLSGTNPKAELAAMYERHDDRDLFRIWQEIWEKGETVEVIDMVCTMAGMTARLYRACREKHDD